MLWVAILIYLAVFTGVPIVGYIFRDSDDTLSSELKEDRINLLVIYLGFFSVGCEVILRPLIKLLTIKNRWK